MSVKAFKLTVIQLKNLLHLFDVNVEAYDKESLIDSLLDFLGAPDPKRTKGFNKKERAKSKSPGPKKRKSNAGKKTPTGKKKTKKEAEEINDETEEDDSIDNEMDVDEPGSPKMPTDAKLRKWVKAYVGCFNLDKATTKHAIETASDKFGINMNSKKAKIKMLLADELS